jgi:glucose/arabinose dehydrogenase
MKLKSKKILVILLVLIVVVLGVFFKRDDFKRWFLKPTDSTLSVGIETSDRISGDGNDIEIVADNLSVPWDIVELPDSDLLITERSGTLRRIGNTTIEYSISEVNETSEGGLLGIVLHPNFQENNYIYLYMTVDQGTGLENQIVRYKFTDNDLREKKVIFSGIPGANTHDGGKIVFGPEGYLYVSTGDANNANSAQDTNVLSGKILRITDNGEIPVDNPFGNAVYSYGHRNPQGLVWDTENRLWSTEHGRSGARSGYDELNRIEIGVNYGWPVIEGDQEREGMRRPIAHSGPDETWAPGGISYADGELFFTGLRGARLYQATIIDNKNVSIQTHFIQEFGRLRASTIAGDYLYISTSNKDGRGNPSSNDDRVFKIRLSIFD